MDAQANDQKVKMWNGYVPSSQGPFHTPSNCAAVPLPPRRFPTLHISTWKTPLLSDGTDFTGVEAPSLTSSKYDMVANVDIQYEAIVDRAGTRNTIENEPSITQLAGNGPGQSDGPSHALTMNIMTLKVSMRLAVSKITNR